MALSVFSELSRQYTDDDSLTVPHEVVSASANPRKSTLKKVADAMGIKPAQLDV